MESKDVDVDKVAKRKRMPMGSVSLDTKTGTPRYKVVMTVFGGRSRNGGYLILKPQTDLALTPADALFLYTNNKNYSLWAVKRDTFHPF